MVDFVFIATLIVLIVSILYVVLFHVREGRDERGKHILVSAYSIAYFILIICLVLVLFLMNWAGTGSSLSIKDIVVLTMALSGITAAATIMFLKKKY